MMNFISRILSSSISLLVVSLVLFIAFGGLFYLDDEVKKGAHNLQNLTINAERILNADLSSTTAVRLAASLQSDRYILNYQAFQDNKYALLTGFSKYAQSDQVKEAFSQMEDVQQDIEDAEAEAIALIDEEMWDEALELVTEPAFRRQKGIYRANLSRALREMIVASERRAQQSNELARIAQYSVLGMFLVLALIGVMYSREMRRSLKRQSDLARNLEDANESLEQRVVDRTAELKRSEAQFKTVLDNMPAIVFLKSMDGRFQLINKRYEDVYEVKFEDIEGKNLYDMFPKDLADEFSAIDQAVIDGGRIFESEHAKQVDGEEIILSSVLFPIIDHNGDVTGFGGVETDITRRKEAEKNLAEKEKQLRAALDNMSDGIYVLDQNWNYSLFNDNYLDLVELPEGSIKTGGSVKKAITAHAKRGDYGPGESADLIAERIKGLTSEFVIETELSIFEGKKTLSLRKSPMNGGGAVVTLSDITERKQIEMDLRDAFNLTSSSIAYASRIQRSILPNDSILTAVTQEHFVLWEPRDVVGGDIYWHGAWGAGCLIVVGDCTGHGVPGAFMTLIAIGALERAMSEIEGGEIGKLITRVHQYIQVSLNQHYEGGDSDDGIELGACYFVPEEPNMVFVGTRFDLHIIKNGEASTIKGTKASMGYRNIPYVQEYEENLLNLSFGESYYLTTDGLIDQVGGERRRMFGKKRFRDLLVRIQDKPMTEQKEVIYEALLNYQGDEKRRDDVSVIGFKF